MNDLKQLELDAQAGNPNAQFLLSQEYFKQQNLASMILWLKKAAVANLPVAKEALGYCFETGRGVAKNYPQALTLYDEAINHGAYRAAFRKAELLYKSRHSESHEEEIRALLQSAADKGFPPAQRTLGYLAMQDADGSLAAKSLLALAAQADDIPACFMLGFQLMGSAQDEAAYWLRKAATRNFPFASTLLANLNSTLIPTPPTVTEIKRLPQSTSIYPASKVQPIEVLDDPEVKLYRGVLDIVDCAYLMFLSLPHLHRADVIDPEGNKAGKTSDVRTNLSTYLPFGMVDIIARYAELKIVQSVGGDLISSEPMSILFYSKGEQYQPHFDYFSPDLEVTRKHLADGGQRFASAVTYLSQPLKGGGTTFPELNITVPAETGSSLWFRNCNAMGEPDPRTLHSGDPVSEGEKWVVTKWFRENDSGYLEM